MSNPARLCRRHPARQRARQGSISWDREPAPGGCSGAAVFRERVFEPGVRHRAPIRRLESGYLLADRGWAQRTCARQRAGSRGQSNEDREIRRGQTIPTKRREAGGSAAGSPNQRTSPSWMRVSPAMHRNKVVLPEPFAPTMATLSPSAISRCKLFKTIRVPYRRVSRMTSIAIQFERVFMRYSGPKTYLESCKAASCLRCEACGEGSPTAGL